MVQHVAYRQYQEDIPKITNLEIAHQALIDIPVLAVCRMFVT